MKSDADFQAISNASTKDAIENGSITKHYINILTKFGRSPHTTVQLFHMLVFPLNHESNTYNNRIHANCTILITHFRIYYKIKSNFVGA